MYYLKNFVLASMVLLIGFSYFTSIEAETDENSQLVQRIEELENQVDAFNSQKNELCNPVSPTANCDWPATSQIITTVLVGLIVSAIIPVTLRHYDKKSEKYSRPLLLESAKNVFDLISGDKNKEIWNLLPDCFKSYMQHENLDVFHKSNHDKIYKFKENLNKLGSLYLADVIDEKFLFNTYGGKIIEFYCYLKADIDHIRKTEENNSEHCLLFECMYYASLNYVQNQNNKKYENLKKKFKEKYEFEIPETIPKDMKDKIPKKYFKKLTPKI